ncbi:hypothetical protein CEXT_489761 [Caerostris extrusa]|uniref:Uncharacterized protein n=1 Tax=Caerostris extrusa TaxID=172846 RepID=A0AAV4PGH1_CAEEX|nr:hypothetical protein CEXT_489761 [Caerostris extrusa]
MSCKNLEKLPLKHRLMEQVYGKFCLNASIVPLLHKVDTPDNNKYAGRPISSKTPENIEKVRDFIANHRCASLRMMEESLNISKKEL